MYTVTLYYNTGYNAINIPDYASRLNNFTQRSFTAIDSVQSYFLTEITLPATFKQVSTADYCKVDDGDNPFYYIINGIQMLAPDTAKLSLVPDFITSAGGAANLNFLDGITVRHHVADDTFGKYDEPDPYTNPTETLDLEIGGWKFNDALYEETILLSTVNLAGMGSSTDPPATIYKDNDTGEYVTVPHLIPAPQTMSTVFEMTSATRSSKIDGVAAFPADESDVQKGVQRCRDIGAETAIINQYAVPAYYVGKTRSTVDGIHFSTLTGNKVTQSTGLNYNFANVQNNRVLYGDNCNYGIITTSGNKAEYSPEQIYVSGDTAPKVVMNADPRPEGRPYFRFESYMGDSSDEGFWMNCVGGDTWRDVPLVFTTKSGASQAAYNFESKNMMQKNAREFERANQIQGMVDSSVHGVANIAGGVAELVAGGNKAQAIANIAMSAYDTTSAIVSQARAMEYASQQYKIQQSNELYNFGVSESVVVPTIMFPYQTGSLRDFLGNGCLVYRYKPSANDISRIDKILTAYGYKHTTILTNDLLTNRVNFNYIQAIGVSIAGNLPQWWKTGIANQFSVGVRIWHTTPSYGYSSNPIVSP